MNNTKRIIYNTLSQHIRTVLNIIISLYSTRLVLDALGKEDYGIYMLIAGIVSLLSYFTNSMVTSIQRSISYSYGSKNNKVEYIFSNSLLLNTMLGALIATVLCSLVSLVFNYGFLNISATRLTEAKYVYLLTVISVFTAFVTAPFKAMLISKENIVYLSMIDILDGILKIALVLLLFCFTDYRLTLYALMMVIISLFHLSCLAIYCKIRVRECKLFPSLRSWDNSIQKELINFTTWTIYGSICVFGRTQGVAVVLNKIFGTVINASYGIATQVFGSTEFLASAILNAFTPQIVKAEGADNRDLMLRLSENASKYCLLLMVIVTIPLIYEMPLVLSLWLGGNTSFTAVLFCRIMLVSTICDKFTIGYGVSIQAIGRIRNYSLCSFTCKLLTVPILWILLKYGIRLQYAICTFAAFELFSALIRIPFAVKLTGVGYFSCFKNVIVPTICPIGSILLTCNICCNYVPEYTLRFLTTGFMSTVIALPTIWYTTFSQKERILIKDTIKNRLHH